MDPDYIFSGRDFVLTFKDELDVIQEAHKEEFENAAQDSLKKVAAAAGLDLS